jgi:curved DNA-binding protein CbpA
MNNNDPRTHYDILGVLPQATAADIKRAHRVLVRKHHPDANANSQAGVEALKAVNAAYEVLSDAEKKQKYDFDLRTTNRLPSQTKPQPQPASPPYQTDTLAELNSLRQTYVHDIASIQPKLQQRIAEQTTVVADALLAEQLVNDPSIFMGFLACIDSAVGRYNACDDPLRQWEAQLQATAAKQRFLAEQAPALAQQWQTIRHTVQTTLPPNRAANWLGAMQETMIAGQYNGRLCDANRLVPRGLLPMLKRIKQNPRAFLRDPKKFVQAVKTRRNKVAAAIDQVAMIRDALSAAEQKADKRLDPATRQAIMSDNAGLAAQRMLDIEGRLEEAAAILNKNHTETVQQRDGGFAAALTNAAKTLRRSFGYQQLGALPNIAAILPAAHVDLLKTIAAGRVPKVTTALSAAVGWDGRAEAGRWLADYALIADTSAWQGQREFNDMQALASGLGESVTQLSQPKTGQEAGGMHSFRLQLDRAAGRIYAAKTLYHIQPDGPTHASAAPQTPKRKAGEHSAPSRQPD